MPPLTAQMSSLPVPDADDTLVTVAYDVKPAPSKCCAPALVNNHRSDDPVPHNVVSWAPPVVSSDQVEVTRSKE